MNRLSKIALATFVWGEEGAGASLVPRLLAKSLVDRGYEVVAIATHKGRHVRRHIVDNIIRYDVPSHNLYWVGDKDSQPYWRRIIWQLWDIYNPGMKRTVQQILAAEQPDILHVHKLRGLSPAVWSAAYGLKIPVIQTCQDYELLSPEGTLTGRIGALAERRTGFFRFYQHMRARLSTKVALATAPSQFTLNRIRNYGFFPEVPAEIIANPHEYDSQYMAVQQHKRQEKQQCEDSTFKILYLGRLEKAKGVDLLCQAVLELPDGDYQLLVAGWGNDKDRLLEAYGHHPHISFCGRVSGKKKENLLSECDLLVVPSTWEEVFGIVIVEAYAHGLPVLAARAGGMPELIREGETGFTFPAGDRQHLTALLRRAIVERKGFENMAGACFAAAADYTIENIVHAFESAYGRVGDGCVSLHGNRDK